MKKKTLEDFIEEANKIHKNYYDYSKVIYENSLTPVEIICPKHGSFFQTPNVHLHKHGCKKCSDEKNRLLKKFNSEDFIKKAIEIHGSKYDYSKVKYNGIKSEVIIICKKHGEFKQIADKHLIGHNCPLCAQEVRVSKTRNSTEDIKRKIVKLHGNRYEFTIEKYNNNRQHIEMHCSKCGKSFVNTIHNILTGSGCPHCNLSKGELKIESILVENKIRFISQKSFPDCKNKNGLLFDFYLPDYNVCIEYQGAQHYMPVKFTPQMTQKQAEEQFEQQTLRDKIKRKFCEQNNITLIEISYAQNIKVEMEKLLNSLI